MNPLSSQEARDFINKLATSPERVLIIFMDIPSGMAFNVVGKLALEDGVITVKGEGDREITDSARFHMPLRRLLRFPCAFVDARDLEGKPSAISFLRGEIRLDFGLTFTVPERVFSILLLKTEPRL